MPDTITLTGLQEKALEWKLNSILAAHRADNEINGKVGLAEKNPEQFKANLRKAILSDPDAEAQIKAIEAAYGEHRKRIVEKHTKERGLNTQRPRAEGRTLH